MTRVGLIGFGYWGPNLARNIAETPGLALAAVADARSDRLEIVARRYPGAIRLADSNELIASDIDAVVIATPLVDSFSARVSGPRARQARPCRKAASPDCGRGRDARQPGGAAGAALDGRSHVRLHRRRAENEESDRSRRARDAPVSGFGPHQPRPVPARQQRHVGPCAARSRDRRLPDRGAADRRVRQWRACRRAIIRRARLHHDALRAAVSSRIFTSTGSRR